MTLDDSKAIQTFRLVRSVANMFFLLATTIIILSFLYSGQLPLLFLFIGLLAIAILFWGWHYCCLQEAIECHLSDEEKKIGRNKREKRINSLSEIIAAIFAICLVAILCASVMMILSLIAWMVLPFDIPLF